MQTVSACFVFDYIRSVIYVESCFFYMSIVIVYINTGYNSPV